MPGPPRRPTSIHPGASSLLPRPELIVALKSAPHEVPPVTRVRSTLLLSSRKVLAERGLFERYDAALTPSERQSLERLVAGRWIGIEVALAHYQAIDRLRLPPSEQIALGMAVVSSVQNVLLASVLRMVQSFGMSPWRALTYYSRLWDRLFMGGDMMIEKLGPREAAVSMYSAPLAAIPYYRVAMRGVQEGTLAAVYGWQRIHVSELAATDRMVKYRIAWIDV